MNKLEELRDEIDKIDVNIIKLFEKRMDISQEIAEYKEKHGLSVYDKNRENQVIEKNLQNAPQKYRDYIREFMTYIMKMSKDIQNSEIGKD